MEITTTVQRLFLKLSFVILVLSVLLWFSIFCYGLLYYLYIPAIAHVIPVHLQYDTSCLKIHLCQFPHANVSLTEMKNNALKVCFGNSESSCLKKLCNLNLLLTRGQVYAIELQLDMPETERNLKQGMFMIRLDMLSDEGKLMQSSRRPAILHYRSPLFIVAYTLFFMPALLAGTMEEKQTLTIPLFEQYVEYESVYYAFIEIEARVVDVYSSTLKIHAQFTGLRYMMYYWPILSFVVGVGSNFFFLIAVIIFVYMKHAMNASQYIDLSHLDVREQETVEEIRRARMEKKSMGTSQRSDISEGSLVVEDVTSQEGIIDYTGGDLETGTPSSGIRRRAPSPE